MSFEDRRRDGEEVRIAVVKRQEDRPWGPIRRARQHPLEIVEGEDLATGERRPFRLDRIQRAEVGGHPA